MKDSSFGQVRKQALQFWLDSTNRTRGTVDDFSNSYECGWQNDLVPEDKHNSLFCSIGEWNSNITDILSESSIDHLTFDDEEARQTIFRYYSRLLLISSEILTDFQDCLCYLNDYSGGHPEANKKATKQLSNPELEFSSVNLFRYVNNICKHKIGNRPSSLLKYHKCNHHIDYQFKDDPNFRRTNNSLKVKNISSKVFVPNMKIEVLSLREIIGQITFGYSTVDRALRRSGRKKQIRTKLERFERELTD